MSALRGPMSRRFPEVAQSRPELVAYHHSRAMMPEAAVPFWQQAGELAVARSGYEEAIAHLSQALEQIQLLPDRRHARPRNSV